MNEGHAALCSPSAYSKSTSPEIPSAKRTEIDLEAVRRQCVFTTHTPVPAGHDQFGLDQMYQILGHDRASAIERAGCLHNGLMNMTYIALRFSRYVNGVAMQHGKVSQLMFPDYKVHSITNGVHAATWLSQPFQELLDAEISSWRTDNQYFRSVYGIDPARISACHVKGKQRLFDVVAKRTGHHFNPSVLTLGFARRVATYKRASLLLEDPARLVAIAEKIGGLQILYAGKAHPADTAGKGLIRDVFAAAARLNSSALKIHYLENYDWELGALLTQGVDVWVNTPRRPYEASGTSGMKAALNGVPSLSVLDGWWIEGCAEGRYRLGHRRRRNRGRRSRLPLRQARKAHRADVRQPCRLGSHAAALHRHQRQLLQYSPHVGTVLPQCVLSLSRHLRRRLSHATRERAHGRSLAE